VPVIEGLHKAATCMVQDVMPGSSAEEAGLQAGDMVRSVDGVEVVGTRQFIELVGGRGGESLAIVVERYGEIINTNVVPRYDPELDRSLIGVVVGNVESGVMPWMEHKEPWAQIKNDAMGIVRILKALVTPRESGQASRGLGGPVLIIATLWIAIKSSFMNAVGFLRFLNINLAILNLLPIPVLDGGHILFALWEMITRRRPNPRLVNALVNVFAALLILALVLLTYRDIIRFGRFFGGARDEGAGTNNVEAVEGQESP